MPEDRQLGDVFDPMHVVDPMTFDEFLDYGDAEERWELIDGWPVVPRTRSIKSSQLATHVAHLLRVSTEKSDNGHDIYG